MLYLISKNKQLFQSHLIQETTLSFLEDWLSNQTEVSLDLETTGFEPMTCDVLSYQFGNKEDQFVVDATTYPIRLCQDIFENSNKLWLGQNIKFDLRFLIHAGIDVWKMKVYDTMLAECILTAGLENTRYGLDALVWKYCQVQLDKSIRGEINYLGLTTRVVQYAAGDVTYLHDIRDKQLASIKEQDLELVLDLECTVTKIFAEMEYNGFQLNKEKWLHTAEESEKKVVKLEKELDEEVLSNSKLKSFIKRYVQESLFGYEERKVNINYASPLQIDKVIKALGFNLESTNAKELTTVSHPFVTKFIDYKKQSKLATTYGKNVLKNIRPNGSITTTFWQIRDTGRVSSGDKNKGYINLQNLPAENLYREPFEVDEGEILIDADYSGMEAVVSAEISGEESWIKANNELLDLHSITCEMIFKDKWKDMAEEDCEYFISKKKCKCPKHKELREKVKTITYLYLFGGGANKLAKQLNVSRTEAQSILDSFRKSLPNLVETVNKVRTYAKKFKYARTLRPYRRKRYFEDYEQMIDEYKNAYIATIDRQSFNHLIQGSSADIVKQAMIYIKEELVNRDIPHKFRLQVHDSIMLSTPKGYEELVKKITVSNMSKAGKIICKKAELRADAYIDIKWRK
jgi:DNA polymerase-1